MKGSRVQSIIRELRGEKIDIVQFSDEVNAFVTNSLNPAKINRVQILDNENRILEVVVDDEQLSLAIGKKGQNVRLASRLSGWRIDIKSEQEKKREVEAEMERMARDARELEALDGVTPKMLEKITASGLHGVEQILEAGVEGLSQIPGLGPKSAEKIVAAAQAMFDTRPERDEAERLAREREEAEEAERRAAETALPEPPAGDDSGPAEGDESETDAGLGAGEPAPLGDDLDAAGEGHPADVTTGPQQAGEGEDA
jgi:N utilization substance protein A